MAAGAWWWALGVLGVGLVIVLAVIVHRRRRRAWTALGEALGYRADEAAFTGIFPALVGRAGRTDVRLVHYATNSGENDASWTAIAAAAPNVPEGQELRVMPQGFGTGVLKIFAGADVEVGDAEFDRAYYVRATDEAWARRVLDARARQAISALAPFHEIRFGRPRDSFGRVGRLRWFVSRTDSGAVGDATVALPNEPTVTIVRRGLVTDEDRTRESVNLVARLAEDLPT